MEHGGPGRGGVARRCRARPRRQHVREHPGGSAANAAVALARLGRSVRFVTAYADDDHGRLLAAHSERPGRLAAATRSCSSARRRRSRRWRRARRPTSSTSSGGSAAGAPRTWSRSWCIFGSIGAALDPGAARRGSRWSRATALGADGRSTSTPARPSPGPAPRSSPGSRRWRRSADVVKASDEDLDQLSARAGPPRRAPRTSSRAGPAPSSSPGARAACAGSRPPGRVDVPAVPAVVADTIGAGDTVTAAIVDALWGLGVVGPAPGRACGRCAPTTGPRCWSTRAARPRSRSAARAATRRGGTSCGEPCTGRRSCQPGSRPMKPISRSATGASSATGTRAPY